MSTSENKPLALIVEDDTETAFIVKRAATSVGFEVVVAYNGEEAATLLNKHHPAVVFLDLALPYVSGEELINMMRNDETFANTEIVVVTASVQVIERIRKKVDRIVTKPLLYTELRDIATELKNKQP